MAASNVDLSMYAALQEREFVMTRVFAAPRELVYRMWTERAHFERWFGPRGFSIQMQEMDIRVGGRTRFVMTGPDGTTWTNRMAYLEVAPERRMVFEHGSDVDDDPSRFRVTVTFEEQGNKKTVLTMRQLHPTKEQRDGGLGFGAVELGTQTMDKLEEHLRAM